MFRTNQKEAVSASINNNFASGVHFHATGTGKSWIALKLALEFQTRHSKSHILWICEQKSILVEQFSRETLKARGFESVYRTFLLLDYSETKPADWVQQVNSAKIWGKPLLIIINRAFLTSSLKYQNLRIPISLLIHDECHSITNATTRAFYDWLSTTSPSTRCIGFSATPVLTQAPYIQVLSSYTIYDAAKEGAIVPPRIVWLKKEDGRVETADIHTVLHHAMPYLPYKKIIVWCGMIETAHTLAKEWSQIPAYQGWMFAVDTTGTNEDSLATYEEFQKCQERGFLFCASKHREGSDIPHLDACIFLDRVANRNAKTFLQCMGRVLRKDAEGRKTHGLILDICAASSLKLCDRIQQYMMCSDFPFQYSFRTFQSLQIHALEMRLTPPPTIRHSPKTDISTLFVRSLPQDPRYSERLENELALFHSKDLLGYVYQALEILAITQSIPHVTRGSCGSSLVCYMLGISHVDPIRWNIKFARFLNEFRDTLPDIDFDFPHILRDEVFLQIQMQWPGQVARISNHVYYHKKSAIREAIRHVGIRKQISTLQISDTIRRLPLKQQAEIQKKTKELENTFRGYSLHCGGIVFYPDGVPKSLKLANKKGAMSQIILNKQDIAKEKRFKVDILSSRALSQLMDARKYAGLKDPLNFEAFMTDEKTAELFRRGDNIGITLAESPLIRKAFQKICPSTLEQVALCLAIIRPAARVARNAVKSADLDAFFVYDDDAIEIIQRDLKCSDAEADKYRRAFTKGEKLPAKLSRKAKDQLKNLRQYSFCKSHAFSYAQLVWQLGYMKAHYPVAFWRATLKHNESMYKKWVHLYEARSVGIDVTPTHNALSIYAENRRRNLHATATSPLEQLRTRGIWCQPGFFPDCYLRQTGPEAEIRGLLASVRVLSWNTKLKRAVLSVGVGPQQYIDLVVQSPRLFFTKKVGITCKAHKEGDVWETEQIQVW